ncbi:MAG: hypothetical protein QG635_611 [Bacteroidota bacterium]|nr:hypothetical protein [Bacteroidota bacterium]
MFMQLQFQIIRKSGGKEIETESQGENIGINDNFGSPAACYHISDDRSISKRYNE